MSNTTGPSGGSSARMTARRSCERTVESGLTGAIPVHVNALYSAQGVVSQFY